MYKKFALSITLIAMLCGISTFPASAATQEEVVMHHHKIISEEQLQSLEKQGYQKHEIWKAARIARASKKDINDVLSYYKQNKSWKETAKHFGVDLKKLHKHHMSKQTKQALLQKIADIQKSTPEQMKKTMQDNKLHLHHLAVLTVIAQKSNTPFNDVLKMKKDGMHVKQIAEKLNVKKEDIRAEMMKLIQSVKENKTN
ncbi:hypothetical protein [Bacillus gaemokensis]|uniref:Glycerate kinase n=1 Tax=Bacillus gaemokensis TaxID=574375 RepID=A0A073KPD7_9BACI|nr:hypothetical protein [Bacillus gaemokensis]KEK24243.1 hypothetical protein BAGA_28120 [Bacillus gaemokensis]KYG38242.1 hypothetical protein AZF08_19590 [Bacillus gaemokensis]